VNLAAAIAQSADGVQADGFSGERRQSPEKRANSPRHRLGR
jgi:hypothetical protein